MQRETVDVKPWMPSTPSDISDAADELFFWVNATRIHSPTHVRKKHGGDYQCGDSEYLDRRMERDDST